MFKNKQCDRHMCGIFLFILLSSINAQGRDFSIGEGIVKIDGSIIDTACAIDIRSREQTIEMQSNSISQLVRDGFGEKKLFSIYLINCSLDTSESWKHFLISFDGITDGDLFGVQGDASGVGLRIYNRTGVWVKPGAILPDEKIQMGDMRLDYYIQPIGNKHLLHAGEYHATIKFMVAYL